ncbi:MAG: winged helix-turn-helix domain-containing protein [Pseudomonadota bacterium]
MVFEFEEFVLDTARLELRHGRNPVALEPKSFDLLLLLVRHADRVVTKDEIFEQVWPDVIVTDSSLSGAIKQIRRALGDDGATQKFIRTIHGRGFRFVGDAKLISNGPAAPIVPAVADQQSAPKKIASPPAIAVLPFKLLGTQGSHGAIAEALPTELIATLSRLKSIGVIARGSAFRFGPTDINFDDIVSRLAADYVLSGSVELFANRLSIYAELTHAPSQRVIWCEQFSGPLEDVFAIRETIASCVSNAVEHRVAINEADIGLKSAHGQMDAWGHYHLGVHHLYRFNGADNQKAEHAFRHAVDHDPGFARAYAGLSYTELENYNLGFGSDKSKHRAQALSLAEKAVDLDPYDPFCNLVLGRAKWIHQEIDEAISWVDRSIDLNPNYAFAHYNNGKLNAIICQGDLADRHVGSAIKLSPIDPHLQSMLSARAMAAFVRQDEAQAVKFADLSVRAPNAHLYVCIIAAAIFNSYGQAEKTQFAMQKLDSLKRGYSEQHFWSLFSLRDPDRQAALALSMQQLGI